jgi:hypothetical protein
VSEAINRDVRAALARYRARVGDLPSAEAKKPGALAEVAATMAGRGALVGAGLYLAGFRGPALLRGTVAATLAVEAFVLGRAVKDAAKSTDT